MFVGDTKQEEKRCLQKSLGGGEGGGSTVGPGTIFTTAHESQFNLFFVFYVLLWLKVIYLYIASSVTPLFLLG